MWILHVAEPWEHKQTGSQNLEYDGEHRQGEVEGCSPPRFGVDELSEKEGKEELSHPEGY